RDQIDRERDVLVLEVRVEPTARGVDGEAFRLSLERQASLLRECGAVQDPDRLIARRRDPDLVRLRDERDPIGHRVELATRAAGELPLVDRADGEVAAASDVDR